MKIEILRIHEDYVTTQIFAFMLLNGFLVLGHTFHGPKVLVLTGFYCSTKFSKPIEEMSKEELNVFVKKFCTSATKKDYTNEMHQ